jgi:hypothetical protein
MTEDKIKQAKELALEIQDSATNPAEPFDATIAVESSLASLLLHRVEKVKDDLRFEQEVKNALLARIPELENSELLQLLNSIQSNSNTSVEKILLPFMPRGERVPLMPDKEKKDKSKEEEMFNSSSKETLQGLSELSKLIERLKKDESVPTT